MSDVHAYLPALKRAIADAKACACNRLVLLGDMIGYGPSSPQDVISACRGAFDAVVKGNHEVDYLSGMNGAGQDCNASWLSSLPDLITEGEMAFTHRALSRELGRMVAGWGYTFDCATAKGSFDAMDTGIRVAFVGHTHERGLWSCNAAGEIEEIHADTLCLGYDKRYIVNVGSVGCPRSEMLSLFVTYDTESRQLSYRCREFDIATYQKEVGQNLHNKGGGDE